MSPKAIVAVTGFIGSIIGGYIPVLFGASSFSFSSLLFSGVGAILGILLGVKISNNI